MRALILSLALAAAAPPVLAQTSAAPSKEALALANRVARSAQPHLEQGLQTLIETLAADYKQSATGANEPVDDKALAEVTKSEKESVKPILWDGMAALYAHIYTVDELKALTAFYKDNPGAEPQSLPASLAAKNTDIQQGEVELTNRLGPRILQDYFGDYCSRAPCSDGIRRVAGLPLKGVSAQAKAP